MPKPLAQGCRIRQGCTGYPARLPDDLFAAIADYASRHGLSFNRALAALADHALAAERRRQQRRTRRHPPDPALPRY